MKVTIFPQIIRRKYSGVTSLKLQWLSIFLKLEIESHKYQANFSYLLFRGSLQLNESFF